MKKKSQPFPKAIVIMGRKFKIKIVENLMYGDIRALGLCDYDSRVIHLEKNQDADSMFSTLVHEAHHALMILCGLDQKMKESEVEIYCQLAAAFVEDIVKAFR